MGKLEEGQGLDPDSHGGGAIGLGVYLKNKAMFLQETKAE